MLDIDDNDAIVEKVKRLCEERRWTPYKLAKKAGLSRNTIYQWFRSKSSPTLSVINAMCDAFGISLVTFLMDDEDYGELTEEQRELVAEISVLPEKSRKILVEFLKSLKADS